MSKFQFLDYQYIQEMYIQMINCHNNTLIFYDERNLHRYYFAKFSDIVYHIVTNSDISRIYSIRNIEYE